MIQLITPSRALIGFLLALSLVPLFAAQFTVTLVNYIGLYALVALGLVLLTGIGGLTSFGQAAFVGLGAYATAYLTTRHGMSPWGTLIVGMVITTAVSLALGFITLIFGLGQLAGPAIAGVLAQNAGSFSSSFYMAAAMAALAILLTALLKKPQH